MQPIEERLDLVRFKVDKMPHIRINTETCKGCDTTSCVFVCPAGLFELLGDEMHFSYEHCLECGTCYVACERKAIEWEYPRGGWGVSFRAS
jgi:ferredoxin like protein